MSRILSPSCSYTVQLRFSRIILASLRFLDWLPTSRISFIFKNFPLTRNMHAFYSIIVDLVLLVQQA